MPKGVEVPKSVLAAFAQPIPVEDPDKLGKHDTKVPCQTQCKGTIMEERSRRYLGDPMHAIIGPGYKNQLTLVVEYYCSRCGIMYHHLPEPARDESAS